MYLLVSMYYTHTKYVISYTYYKWYKIMSFEMFFEALDTEHFFHNSFHFQQWHLCCRYLGHRSFSISQTWLLFWQGVLLLASCVPRLKSSQSLCRTKSNAVFSLLAATATNKATQLHIGINPHTITIRTSP